MRKALIVLVLIAGAAYFIHRQSQVASSEEVQLVRDLQARFSVALNQFTSAVGRSGTIGIDASYDTEASVTKIEKIRKELAELRERLTEPAAVKRADTLAEKIDFFCQKNNILLP